MDDDSHVELKQPFNRSWDRGVHARLLERLTAEHATAVVYDIVFSDPNLEHPEGDDRFAKAIKDNGKVILGADYEPTGTGSTQITRAIDPFIDAAAGWGFAQVQQDQDFMVRRHLHVSPKKDDDIYSSISWETAKLVGVSIAQDPAQRYFERWVNYYGPPDSIPAVSFRLAMEPNYYCPSGFFSNKVVFIGAYLRVFFSGQRKDELRSPYTKANQFIPLVDVQATQFLNLLRGDWLLRIPRWIELVALIVSAIMFGFGFARLQPWIATGFALLAAFAVTLLALYLFLRHHFWFPWLIITAVQIPMPLFSSIVFNSVQLYVQNKL